MIRFTDKRGFTLLELIIAFSILMVILLIVGSGLRIGIRAWEKGEEIVDETQRIRVLRERLSYEIKSTYPYQIEGEMWGGIAFEGKSDSLSFVTTAVGSDGRGGFKWVSYYMKEKNLMIKEKRLPDKELDESKGKEAVIESSIKDITFEYYEKNNEDWEKSWNGKEKGRLPEIIKVTVTKAPETLSRSKRNKGSFPPLFIVLPVAYNSEWSVVKTPSFR